MNVKDEFQDYVQYNYDDLEKWAFSDSFSRFFYILV
jgi:hypothetical protein